MIKFFTFLLFVSTYFFSYSQGYDCGSSTPFCTGSVNTFPASTNVPNLGAVGCLGSTPNPAWYFFQVQDSGSVDIYMTSAPSADIDFICWGPFDSLSIACVSNLMTNPGIDCSYSSSWNETVNIPSGVVGQIYILLITNFSNQACDISFSQTGGTGSLDCSIVPQSISDFESKVVSSINYYPLPFNDVINIKTNNIFTEEATLEVFDILGNVVMKFELNNISYFNNNFFIDGSMLKSGSYFVHFKSSEYEKFSNIVKL
jgi:hypothetical protein